MLPLFIALQVFTNDVSDRIRREEKGATAVEYGLLVGLVSIAIVAALLLLGPRLDGLFRQVLAALP